WYDTEISTTPLNGTDLLADGDYWASQTDGTGCESATRLVVNVTITKPLPPTITETNQAFCEIDAKTVADLGATGTGILWYDTETSATPLNGTDLLADGDYWASQTDGTGCESTTRLVVNVTILNSPSPTTTEANQTFCEIEAKTVADLNAIGTGILWYDTEISTTPLNGTDLLSDGDYWASQTETSSNCESASRLVVNVSITKPLPPTSAATIQSFCMKDYLAANPTIAELDAIGNNIVWYDTAISTTPLATTDILIDGKNYFASQTDALSGCESAARLAITVSLINPTTPSTSQTNQSFCKVDNPTISNLNVVGTTIIWYADETTTTALSSSESLINGEDYWAAASDATTGCESIARIGITVTINDALPPTISTITQRFCASSSPKISDLNVSGNGIVWYASETDNTPINPTELLVDSEDYWAAQTNPSTGCISSMRKVANVILTDPGTPAIISLGNEFCKIDKPTLADLDINVSANSGGTISWYDSYPNGNLLSASTTLVEGETYYAIETTVNDCKSINPLAVIVSLEACDAYEVEIYDGFSPSGNGVNDTFKLGNLRDLYPNFKVEFFNRWGTLVYTANASKPDWDGRLNGDGELVPAGVYYFIINFNKNDRKPIQRRLYLSR
ncbi:MAG: gliding motility-associated C-terminal domain-containing protein, partial [Flavobacteriaceae bacterium]|nr:gliding motility-associated C-terminal domain-containing protein [Flavobacteriaceae bacterium]